ncbi:zinc-binding dehydrogenase [Mammaliicoccus lentus]|uniref:zinc-binding dehydrogenase n=1 Tax=Mammaliicoccus lentus TaxID=42858 RepID=UPI003F56048A
MKTSALRLYGKNDLRLEEFELPKIQSDEILATVVTDSACMSTWKATNQASKHKKVPDDVANSPIIVGHEFCGEILKVGSKWKNKFNPGQKYVVQANLQLKDRPDCPGYSFQYCGGNATHIIIPKEVMEQDCLLTYEGETYFEGSLIEPLSCIIGAYNANYHIIDGTYKHDMGIKNDGNMIIMGGSGPMGLLGIDYALHGPRKPKKLVVTTRGEKNMQNVLKLYEEDAKKAGIEFHLIDTNKTNNQEKTLMNIVNSKGYDDVFVFVPVSELVTIASNILASDGCMNFFAGPQDTNFKAEINFYDIHYQFTHYVGTSGGNTDDMRQAIELIENKIVDVSKIVSHIMGLNAVADTILDLPKIKGGKKLSYSNKIIPRKSLVEITEERHNDDFYQGLQKILKSNNGLWSKESEDYVLTYGESIY